MKLRATHILVVVSTPNKIILVLLDHIPSEHLFLAMTTENFCTDTDFYRSCADMLGIQLDFITCFCFLFVIPSMLLYNLPHMF